MRSIIVLSLLGLIWVFSQTHLFAFQPSNQCYIYPGCDLREVAYAAADNLEYNITSDIDRTLPLVTSCFVQEDDFTTTSALGRQLGELIGSRLSQHGYKVTDLRLRKDTLAIRPGIGELALSRNMQHLKNSTEVQAVIAGSYNCLEDRAIVSSKIINTKDNSLLAAHDFEFRLNSQLKGLCNKTAQLQQSKPKPQEQYADEPYDQPLVTGTIILDPSKSTDAKLIQSRLADLGLYLDKIDGAWGKNSKIALKKFKNRHQLPDPEKWDMRTQVKLFTGTQK